MFRSIIIRENASYGVINNFFLTQNSTQETPLSMKKCIAYKSIKYLEGSVRQRLNKLRNYIKCKLFFNTKNLRDGDLTFVNIYL